jgi:heme a synthase
MVQEKREIWLHRVALLTAVVTFPLIFLGGLVTSHGAGMSVPDWPNTWGYNMFLFPPSKWVGGILFEHTHRLMASFVGLMTIVTMVVAFWAKKLRWTAVGLFAACLFQGVLGGLRVVLSARDLAIVHGCAAQLFFCFAATFCVLSSKFWSERTVLAAEDRAGLGAVYRASILAVIVVFGQLVIGAIMRHSGAGLAIPDFPTSYGRWIPPTALNADFRQQAIHQYGADLGISQVSLFQIWIHFAHRLGAVAVTLVVVWLAAVVLRKMGGCRALMMPAVVLLLLVGVQLTLGILTVLMRKPADIASAHVAVGSLVLMTAWVMVMRTAGLRRFAAPIERVQSDGRAVEEIARPAGAFGSPTVSA